jgi:uncharacterized membrane protein
MSEHAEKAHPIGAVIMVLILTALCMVGLSLMNAGQTVGLILAGALFLLVGLVAVFHLGKA